MKDRYTDPYEEYTDYADGYCVDYPKSRKGSRDIYSDSGFENRADDTGRDIYSDSGRREKTPKTPKKGKRIAITVVCIVLVLALGVFGAGFIFLERIASKVHYEQVEDIYSSDSAFYADTSLKSSSSVKNILICGVDQDDTDFGRSDSMILLSVDTKNEKLKMTSFQRDTFVFIPDADDPDGGYRSKLTNAYVYGGVGLTMRTIEYNFGVRIDNYITVNFETFKTIVDILGGIELELTQREIQYINCQIEQNNQTDYLDAEEGLVTLNGQQALWHARNRGGYINGVEFYEDTDWDRTQRQRDFLKALVSDVKETSIFKLIKIADGVSSYITTDMEKSELKKFLLSSIKYRKYSVSECSMPCEDSWEYVDNFAGNVIYVNDWELVRANLAGFIYED